MLRLSDGKKIKEIMDGDELFHNIDYYGDKVTIQSFIDKKSGLFRFLVVINDRKIANIAKSFDKHIIFYVDNTDYGILNDLNNRKDINYIEENLYLSPGSDYKNLVLRFNFGAPAGTAAHGRARYASFIIHFRKNSSNREVELYIENEDGTFNSLNRKKMNFERAISIGSKFLWAINYKQYIDSSYNEKECTEDKEDYFWFKDGSECFNLKETVNKIETLLETRSENSVLKEMQLTKAQYLDLSFINSVKNMALNNRRSISSVRG